VHLEVICRGAGAAEVQRSDAGTGVGVGDAEVQRCIGAEKQKYRGAEVEQVLLVLFQR
jgi:hypothetical protein